MIGGILEKFGISLPPLPSAPPSHEAERRTLFQLAALIGCAVLLHFQIADLRIGFFALAIYLLKVGLLLRNKNAPNRIVMMLLTIISLGLIIALYGGWNGQRAGISFLVLLVTLKFLESRALRDYFVVCLILYFLAASSFLFNSSMLNITIVIGFTLMITNILFQMSDPTPRPWVEPFRASAGLVIKALPLAVILFFFFPRVQGSFGFLPSQDLVKNERGLADSLVAGEMAQSAFNTSLAFRATFDGEIPSNENLYWRAKVMPTEALFAWKVVEPDLRKLFQFRENQQENGVEQGNVSYTILHEKSKDKYLPFLDYVKTANRGTLNYDYSVLKRKFNQNRFEYSGTSTFESLSPNHPEINTDQFLQTVSKQSPRMLALLAKFREQAQSERELVQLVFDYFAQDPFSYSLLPPGLNEFDPIDDFIFNTRTGYCEHYASAFTIMMRWLRIPSRVVAGYQGGKVIRSGNNAFLEVRYADAHAWSEVWLDDRWHRVDPTAAISPERIEFGMDALMELWESGELGGNDISYALSNYLNPTGMSRVLNQLQNTWSNFSYQWNKWIVNYDFKAQQELLSQLGFENKNSIVTLVTLMFGGAGFLLIFYFWRLIPRSIKRSEAQANYLKFVAKFKKYGVEKHIAESPSEFAARAQKKFPQQSNDINNITRQYHRIRYGRSSTERNQQITDFKDAVKAFKIIATH